MVISTLGLLNHREHGWELNVSQTLSFLPIFTFCNILVICPLFLLLIFLFYKNSVSFLFTELSEIAPLPLVLRQRGRAYEDGTISLYSKMSSLPCPGLVGRVHVPNSIVTGGS